MSNNSQPEQPAIADVLGVKWDDPISDAEGWAKIFPGKVQIAPEAPTPEMFDGLLGELTRTIAPQVPFDPVAFHYQALVAIGNYLGYDPYVADGQSARRANLFLTVVMPSGSGKGSSKDYVKWLIDHIDIQYRQNRWLDNLQTPQGLLVKITDPVFGKNAKGEEVVTIDGSDDKRLLYLDEELENLFIMIKKNPELRTLVTKAWDSDVMSNNVQKDSMKVNEPHVSAIGHITPQVLRNRIEPTMLTNGYSNRWLYVIGKPTAYMVELPPAGGLDGDVVPLAQKIAANVQASRANLTGKVPFTPDASALIEETAKAIQKNNYKGMIAEQSTRWKAQIFKLSLIYAAIDGSDTIRAFHVAAARSAWAYAHRCANAFFSGLTGNDQTDALLQMWSTRGYQPLTLDEIGQLFNNKVKSNNRLVMMDELVVEGVVSKHERTSENGGRPATVYSFNGMPSSKDPTATW